MTSPRSTIAVLLLVAAPLLATETTPVGVARVDITPETPVRMYGYAARKTESEGVAGPLTARALTLGGDDSQGPAVLLCVDCGSVPVELRDRVFEQITEDAILAKARLADRFMSRMKGSQPRIGVCALNPHSGEGGLFGVEEQTIIRPAVERGVAEGLQLEGPFPTDTLMIRARDGHFDAIVAMFHDQGHIALKLLGMHRAVNITLGLPIVRTSVAHGTAFDIAWKRRVETGSMIEAIRVASILALGRNP